MQIAQSEYFFIEQTLDKVVAFLTPDCRPGSEQEPTHVLSERRLLKSTRTTLPPPTGRSPYKTNIGSSPRRQSSAAPQSRFAEKTPEPALSKPAVKRKLDFFADEPRPSIEFSPGKEPMKGPLYAKRDTTHAGTSVYELQPSPSVGSKRKRDSELIEEQPDEEDEPYLNGFDDNYEAPLYDKDDDEMIDGNFDAPIESPISSPIMQQPKKRGRKSNGNESTVNPALLTKKQAANRSHIEDSFEPDASGHEEPAVGGASKAKKKRTSNGSRQASSRKRAQDSSILTEGESSIAVPTANDPSLAAPKRGRGRPKGSKTKVKVHQDLVVGETADLAPPAKKAKTTKAAPKERDANIMMPPPLRPTKTPSVEPPSRRSATLSPSKRAAASRTLTILREGTPAEDPGASRTRSGRHCIKPLEYWLGERSERDPDGTLVGIVRAESVAIASRPYTRRASAAPTRSKASSARARRGTEDTTLGVIREEGYEAEEVELEEWEAEGGVIRGFVRTWDAMLNTADETDMREQDLAFSSNSIETRDVVGSDFKYAKFLSLPFFGCGMVDIPPGGFKRAKNSRKMQMVFFVHKGKVLVRVGEAEFSISKGGVWHVPRGEFCFPFLLSLLPRGIAVFVPCPVSGRAWREHTMRRRDRSAVVRR